MKHHHKDLKRQAAWTGTAFAAGEALGPAGSATVGVVHHGRELTADGDERNRALEKICAPIAASAALGPVGALSDMRA